MAISTHVFNINGYSDEARFRDFRFQRHEISKVVVSMSMDRPRMHIWDLLRARAPKYASAIVASGGTLDRCVGFIDGTKIKITRPSGTAMIQRAVYSGHKRMHCLTYQSISTPDGLIFHLFGPVEVLLIDQEQYYIYGDQAYVVRPWLQTAYRRSSATTAELTHNKAMNNARVAVEWSYGELKNAFASQDFSRKLQVAKLPVAALYIVCALLRNFKTCLGHRTIAETHFDCSPPTLEEYCTL
eukprot:IDg4173t1